VNKLVLVGGGGHCKSVLDCIIRDGSWQVVGILDIEENVGKEISGIQIIGTDDMLPQLSSVGIKNAFLTVGCIFDNKIRHNLYSLLKKYDFSLPVIKDPSAIVSDKASIGEGTFIGKGCIVNVGAKIGKMCIVNTSAVIEHDCSVESFVNISPGAVLCGGVTIGQDTFIGAASVVIQGVAISDACLIGAGSVVTKNISHGIKAFGNPCREATRL
jgi:sugar O-acyltransferase (sialic acid O-acetyltransferase NeuD family)